MASLPLGIVDNAASASLDAGVAARPDGIHAQTWQDAASADFLEDWRSLEERAAEPNPFYSHWYLPTSLEALAPDERIRLVQYWRDGKLAGILPLGVSNSYYGYPIPHLSGWLHDNAFCGIPLVASGMEDAFWKALLNWADAQCATGLFLHLSQLPENSPVFAALLRQLDAEKRLAAIVHREERALLMSDSKPEDYLAEAMSGKKRKELRRQFRRLSELGQVHFEKSRSMEGLDLWLDEFLALEVAGWKGREGSALACNRRTERLFRNAIEGAAKSGQLERLALLLDGRPIAMLANFVCPPGAFSFKTAFDEQFAQYSPGVLLQRENLAMLEDPAVNWTDSCAAADHPMIERIWREKRSICRLSIGVGGRLRQAAFRQLLRAESSAQMVGEK